jgi:O-antigen/teichoic acid export membrane protein
MSNKKNYLLTYFWSILEYLTYFLSMFLVTPKITGTLSKEVYGAYMTVVGYTVFLNYMDFGFLGAANKYGCDEYIRGNKEKEIEILAGVSFIQILTFSVFSAAMIFFSQYPDMIIKGLNEDSRQVSQYLFALLAIFVFGSIPRRIITIIAQFRIQMYQVTSWLIIGNLMNIGLIYIILRNNNGINIVYYYFFSNLIILVIVLFLGIRLFRKWKYPIRLFLKNLKIKKDILKYLWPFAKASLFSSVMYMLYYEVDTVYIAKFISAEQLAIYVIGFSLMGFFRRLSSTLNGPYVPKYNEYYVKNDDIGMKNFYFSNIAVIFPFIIIPAMVSIILMPQFIIAYVGDKYYDSIFISQILIASYLYGSLTDISSYVIVSKVKINIMYISSAIVTVIFWLIIFIFIDKYGIQAVAFAKTFSLLLSSIFTIYFCNKLLKIRFFEYAKIILLPGILSIGLAFVLSIPFQGITTFKSKIELIKIMLIMGAICLISISFYIFISKQFKYAVGEELFSYKKIKEKVIFYKRNLFKSN